MNENLKEYVVHYDIEANEWIARSTKYTTIIGAGDTQEEAIKELKIFVDEYEDYLKEENQKDKNKIEEFPIDKVTSLQEALDAIDLLRKNSLITNGQYYADKIINVIEEGQKAKSLLDGLEDLENIKKEHEALEIIRSKPLLTPCIFFYETFDDYIKDYWEWDIVKQKTCYTPTEFNKLKEVLRK